MSNISHTKIIPYQSVWPKKFQVEKENLQKVFGSTALEIEHIGSTSIEGLLAKPIIDIVVMIENHENADAFADGLAQIGYKFHSSSTERLFYTKGDPIEYHLSIAYVNKGGFWPRQILFRDYLRTHPDIRDEYAKLKTDLLLKDPTGIDGYIAGKTEFVQGILKQAGLKENQKYKN